MGKFDREGVRSCWKFLNEKAKEAQNVQAEPDLFIEE